MSVTKAFSPNSIAFGNETSLTITINLDSNEHDNISLTDTLPFGLTFIGTSGSTCGSDVQYSASGNVLTVSGFLPVYAPPPANSSCGFSVGIYAPYSGTFNNTTSALTSNGVQIAGAASATLTVTGNNPVPPPSIGKSFSPSTIAPGGTTTLAFDIYNTNTASPITGVTFTDHLQSGLVVASSPNVSNNCGGTVTANAGASTISFTNGSVPSSSFCEVDVNVTVTGSTGTYNNSVSLNTAQVAGNTATAALTVAYPPSATKSFNPGNISANGTSTLTITITAPSQNGLTNISFDDFFPNNLVVASTPNASTTCTGGSIFDDTSGSGDVGLSVPVLAAGASCSLSVNVTAPTGSYPNSVEVDADQGSGTSNTATLTAATVVVSPPSITKTFGASTIPVSGTTSLTFKIANPNASTALTNVSFTDTLPAGLVVATPNGLTGNSCPVTPSASSGSSTISLTVPTFAGGPANCQFTVNVTGTGAGAKTNSVTVSSTNGGLGNTSTAPLTVIAPPSISKAFGAATIPVGSSTSLVFTLSNPNSGTPLTGAGFSDTLPSGLIATGTNSNSCGGTLSAAGGTITLSGGTIPVGGSCQASVQVGGLSAGPQNNVTSAVTSSNGGTGNTASASITVLGPPTIRKAFGAGTVPLGGTTSLTFTITNPNSGTALTGVTFTDQLPAGLTITGGEGPTFCGGAASIANGTLLQLNGITVPAGGTCTPTFTVTATANGVQNNTTSPVSSTNGGAGGPSNTATITVVSPPSITKAFGAATIPVGGTTSLTFTITNPNSTLPLSGVAFADAFPAGLSVATPAALTNSCSGTATAIGGSSSVSLSGGTVPANSSCTVVVNVTGTTNGVQNNVSGAVTSTNGGTGNTASASITVLSPATIAKAFGGATIPVGGTTSLTFTITNPNSTSPLTGVAFTDALPAGLLVATPNALTNSCGGTVTAPAGSTSISLTGGTVAQAASCQIVVKVTGTTSGVQNNVTGAVTSTNGGTGNTASASITVLSPATIAKAFGGATIPVGGTTTLTFTITNPNSTSPLTGVAFTDALPAGLIVATPNALTNSCGGTVTAPAGSTSVSLTGGTVAASSSCTVIVNVTGATSGTQTNVTGAVTSTNGGSGNTANANITVLAPPSISKAFSPTKFVPNGTGTLSFTLSNPNALALTGVAFTDTLPAGLLVATPNQLTSTCSGVTTAAAGSSAITLTGGTIAGSAACTISVSVTAANDGIYNNVSGAVTSANGGTGNTAAATVTVAAPPTIAKSFSAVAIPTNGSAVLTFTITNTNTAVTLTGVTFTDTLPNGLTVSTPNGLSGGCGDGPTVTAPAGSNSISLSGGFLSPGDSCTFSVDVTASQTGPLVNTTGAITSDQTVPGGTASATITVGSVYQVNYSANLNVGDSFINLVNTGENGVGLLGPGFGTPTGNVCVNVYAMAPDEQLISCCSCLVTPDGLASLSIDNDILSNTASGAKPDSVVIKLITTLAGAGGSGTTCASSAAVPGTLASGTAAWSTTLHATTTPGDYALTDRNFTQATLNAQELASLTGRCMAIIGNNSGAGICNACRSGGLGAEKSQQ